MKNYILVLIVMGVAVSIEAQIDTVNQRMLSMKSTIEKPHTLGSVYYKIGETQPFTGVLYGRYTNGNYLSIQEYKNGVGNGKWVNYYENGIIKEIGNYNDNRVEGPIKQFHPNGQLKAKGVYKHWRKKIGIWRYYDINGILIKKKNHSL